MPPYQVRGRLIKSGMTIGVFNSQSNIIAIKLTKQIFLELSDSLVKNTTHSILKRECDEEAVFL